MRLVPPKPDPARAPLALVVDRARGELTDAELAHGLARGDDWAVTVAWHRFAPLVFGMAERALGSRSDAQDLAQEVFARLFRRAATLREAESLRSFVYSIAVRTLKSELRYRRIRAWLSFHAPEALTDSRQVTLDVESRDVLRRFYRLLDRLSPRDRLVFVLRRIESMTVEEIAATMRISESTVKRSLSRASARLSRWVDGDPGLRELVVDRAGAASQ